MNLEDTLLIKRYKELNKIERNKRTILIVIDKITIMRITAIIILYSG